MRTYGAWYADVCDVTDVVQRANSASGRVARRPRRACERASRASTRAYATYAGVCDVCGRMRRRATARTYRVCGLGVDVAAPWDLPSAQARPDVHTRQPVLLGSSFYARARFRTPSFFFVTTGAVGADDDDEGAVNQCPGTARTPASSSVKTPARCARSTSSSQDSPTRAHASMTTRLNLFHLAR